MTKKWPFDQTPDTAVLTTTHVIEDGLPIQYVFHDQEDHGWQFHYKGEESVADAMMVPLQEIVDHDPSILDLATMPPGMMAYREKEDSEWIIIEED